MLQRLTVQNYALIESLQLNFGKRLNIITGETGAGKSILLGALGLLLGDRADSSTLPSKGEKCIIEGEFLTDTQSVNEFISTNDLDQADSLLIRREINKDGKSRAFINDTPVTIAQLRELGQLIVDIHSQHETLLLNKIHFQLAVVDAFASHADVLKTYKSNFISYTSLKLEIETLRENEKKLLAEQDYLNYQFTEMDEAALVSGEQEKLEEEFKTLVHAGEIKSGLDKITSVFSGTDQSAVSICSQALHIANSISKYSPQLEDLFSRIKSMQIELNDIAAECENINDRIQADPGRQESVSIRLDTIYRLQKKHNVKTVDELLTIKDELESRLGGIEETGNRISILEKDLEKRYSSLLKAADEISKNRSKALGPIESKVKKMLLDLGMPDAVLKIQMQDLPDGISITGKDKIQFLFSANKGIGFSDISKVASGGELSRLMLCLKAIVAKLIDLPTLIFDEIDTGVSGETAFQIGSVMKDLATNRQIIAISHLPQIAGRGEDHFFVYKEVSGKKTFTRVKKLSADERVVEIARMIGGEKPTAVAIENAKELLERKN
jgi:DNA repair protein RecN (Recombination protein N)